MDHRAQQSLISRHINRLQTDYEREIVKSCVKSGAKWDTYPKIDWAQGPGLKAQAKPSRAHSEILP